MNIINLRNSLFATIASLAIMFSSFVATAAGNAQLKNEWRAARPLIEVNDGVKKGSEFLKSMQDTLLRMNDLSYNLAKGKEQFLNFAVNEQESLQSEGWIIKGFKGLEGRRSNYVDLSGIVCYHPQKNIIAVIYHGTAGNIEGWETNFDGTQLETRKILGELQEDLREQLLDLIDETPDTRGTRELHDFVSGLDPEDFNSQSILNTQTLINSLNDEGAISDKLKEDLLDAIQLKLDLINYVKTTTLAIKGKVHKGFAKKYYSTKREVLGLIKQFIDATPADKKDDLKIVFSGHSQAGGTGSLALADITANHGKELFGPQFTNSTNGTFSGYLLSAARIGNKDYVRWMHEHVGKDYVARQNVKGDPVPFVAGDRKVAEFLRQKIPEIGGFRIGDMLAEMADYDDAGHLLLDDGVEAWSRARQIYESAGLSIDDFDTFDETVRFVAGWIVDENMIPDFLVTKDSVSTINPFLWVYKKARRWLSTYKAGKVVAKAILGDRKAITTLTDLLQQRYGHLHYGLFKEGIGATFDTRVVGRDIDHMLSLGEKHENEKRRLAQDLKREQCALNESSARPVCQN